MEDVCPICGCEDVGKGVFEGHAKLRPARFTLAASRVTVDVCTACGFMYNFYAAKPQIFKKKS